MQTLFIIRGIPGSGKSTMAKHIVEINATKTVHFEADMFFMNDGKYYYNQDEVRTAHAWCVAQTEHAILSGLDVVVANTFIQNWTITPYHTLANKYGIEIVIIEAKGNYDNIHGVPESVIADMKNKYEP